MYTVDEQQVLALPKPKSRRIYLVGEITAETVALLTKEIYDIRDHDEEIKRIYGIYGLKYEAKPIEMVIDSPGGYVYQTLGLVSVMMTKGVTPVNTTVTGYACSGAFLVAICGDHRRAYRYSTFMYHQAWGGIEGSIQEAEEDIQESKRIMKDFDSIVVNRTNLTKEMISKIHRRKLNFFIGADEALKHGCIDEVV